jgi:hypothetical protein
MSELVQPVPENIANSATPVVDRSVVISSPIKPLGGVRGRFAALTFAVAEIVAACGGNSVATTPATSAPTNEPTINPTPSLVSPSETPKIDPTESPTVTIAPTKSPEPTPDVTPSLAPDYSLKGILDLAPTVTSDSQVINAIKAAYKTNKSMQAVGTLQDWINSFKTHCVKADNTASDPDVSRAIQCAGQTSAINKLPDQDSATYNLKKSYVFYSETKLPKAVIPTYISRVKELNSIN